MDMEESLTGVGQKELQSERAHFSGDSAEITPKVFQRDLGYGPREVGWVQMTLDIPAHQQRDAISHKTPCQQSQLRCFCGDACSRSR